MCWISVGFLLDVCWIFSEPKSKNQANVVGNPNFRRNGVLDFCWIVVGCFRTDILVEGSEKFCGNVRGWPLSRDPPETPFERPQIHVLGRNAKQNGQSLDERPDRAPNTGNLGSSCLAQLPTHARNANTNTEHDFPARDRYALTPKPPITYLYTVLYI